MPASVRLLRWAFVTGAHRATLRRLAERVADRVGS
jgi:hypothetical protein